MENLFINDPVAMMPWKNEPPVIMAEEQDAGGESLKEGDETVNALPERLALRMISMTENYPEIDFLLEKEGVGCVSAGDIVVLKGKAKAGKTTAMVCLITALLKGEYLGFRAVRHGAKVLFVDTEQNPINTSILAKKVHALCGFEPDRDHPRFRVFNFRGDTAQQRSRLLDEAVKLFTPDLLVIDGAKDLIDGSDINDPKASGKVIQSLMSLTKIYNLAILTTLHENKSDANLRGHVGTELLNKCSECWQVRKNEETFETEQTECRNEPAGGFSFRFNGEKLPVETEHVKRLSPSEMVDQRIKENFMLCLPQGTTLRYSELKKKYTDTASCSSTSADNHISKALRQGWLKKYKEYYSYNCPT